MILEIGFSAIERLVFNFFNRNFAPSRQDINQLLLGYFIIRSATLCGVGIIVRYHDYLRP